MMGHQGMRYSLVSREVIADSIEVVAAGMNHDGILAIGGCDKNMPGCVMAMARLNIPSIFVYGGSILPGTGETGNDIDIVSIFEAVGQFQAGKLDEKGVHQVECEACPGAGSCGGMYTANTMSSAIEAMGMSLPYDASYPAVSAAKERETFLAGKYLVALIEKNIKPRDIITRKSLENAYTLVLALGGSTNAVLHLMAIAREAEVPVDARRLRSARRQGAGSGRPEAGRQIRDVRPAQGRRHPGRPARRCSTPGFCTATA